jgi:hypothetical protein
MSPERKGSSFGRSLFNKAVDAKVVEEWASYDSRYNEAVNIIANEKKRPELVTLDKFLREELAELIHSRSPPHLLHSELAQVMKWKLTRGKFRPLQKLVESNSSESVIDASTQCFRFLAHGDWEKAISAISKLKAVGVATASAICCVISPSECPFMADEALEAATSEGRDYSIRAYSLLRDVLQRKAQQLGPDWTADRVSHALWACAIINAHSSQPSENNNRKRSLDSSSNSKGPKKSSAKAADFEDSAVERPQRKKRG